MSVAKSEGFFFLVHWKMEKNWAGGLVHQDGRISIGVRMLAGHLSYQRRKKRWRKFFMP